MNAANVDSPLEALSDQWLAALALPIQQIDSSHLATFGGDLNALPLIHDYLWSSALRIRHEDLLAVPFASILLILPRRQFTQMLGVFGLLLLAPSIRQVIQGARWRAIMLTIGDPARRWIESPDLGALLAARSQAGESPRCKLALALARIQVACSIAWDSVEAFGADAPLIVATAWLHRRLRAISPALWTLLRLRLPMAVLVVVEEGNAGWTCEANRGSDPNTDPAAEPAIDYAANPAAELACLCDFSQHWVNGLTNELTAQHRIGAREAA
jgi:hypothetical protein